MNDGPEIHIERKPTQQQPRTEASMPCALTVAHSEVTAAGSARQEIDQLNALLAELLGQPRIGDATHTWDRIMARIGHARLRRAA